jgi:hypothetical protein
METQSIITIMSIVLPLFGAAIGYFIKQSIEKKKEILSEVTKERRLIYQQYVNLIMDIFANTKEPNGKKINMVKELYGFYKKYMLYASPNVIKAFSDYFQFLYTENTQTSLSKNMKLLSKIMLEMRKDLGLKNNGLGSNGEMLLRAILKDYDEVLK